MDRDHGDRGEGRRTAGRIVHAAPTLPASPGTPVTERWESNFPGEAAPNCAAGTPKGHSRRVHWRRSMRFPRRAGHAKRPDEADVPNVPARPRKVPRPLSPLGARLAPRSPYDWAETDGVHHVPVRSTSRRVLAGLLLRGLRLRGRDGLPPATDRAPLRAARHLGRTTVRHMPGRHFMIFRSAA